MNYAGHNLHLNHRGSRRTSFLDWFDCPRNDFSILEAPRHENDTWNKSACEMPDFSLMTLIYFKCLISDKISNITVLICPWLLRNCLVPNGEHQSSDENHASLLTKGSKNYISTISSTMNNQLWLTTLSLSPWSLWIITYHELVGELFEDFCGDDGKGLPHGVRAAHSIFDESFHHPRYEERRRRRDK